MQMHRPSLARDRARSILPRLALTECVTRGRAPAPNLGDVVILGEENGVVDQHCHQDGDAEVKPRHQGKCLHRTVTSSNTGYDKGEACNSRSPSDGDRYDH